MSYERRSLLSQYFLDTIWPHFMAGFRNPSTKDSYFSDICTFSEFIKKDILESTFEDCKRYTEYLYVQKAAGAIKQSTIVKKHKELSALFTFICNGKYQVPRDFTNWFIKIEVEVPTSSIHANTVLSVTDIDILVGYLRENNEICFIAFLLALKQMLRTSEMVNLKVPDITLDEQNVPCLRIKESSGHVRYNKIAPDVFEAIMHLISDGRNGYILSKDGRKPYAKRTLQKYLSDACAALNMKSITFNDLRNTGTVYSISNGASIELVNQELGMVSNRHITRLQNTVVTFNNASDYVNVELKK